MKVIKRVGALILSTFLIFGTGLEALAAGQMNLTIEEAVVHGIENSKILDEVEVEIDLAKVSKDRGSWTSRKLRRSDRDLSKANKDLGKAENLFNQGLVPQDIPELGITAGTPIDKLPQGNLPGTDIPIKDYVTQSIKDTIEKGKEQLSAGDLAIASALEQAGATIGTALDFASLNALSLDGSADLIELMPDVAHEVTQASFDIYKNNIALLIQKSYYDALQAEELVKVRKAAMERGKKQYEFSKAGFEEGMKAKDDAITAEMYYKGTKILYEQALGELRTAKTELKKNANLDMNLDIILTDVMVREPEEFNLEEGLKSGMANRLEMKKTLGEVLIYNTNFNETKSSYTPNTFQYREAELLKQKAGVKYRQAQDEVEGSIRKSYDLVNNTGDMLRATEGLVDKAKENVEITNYKYQEGYGVNTSMLATMHLTDQAGTILEVLAAEEKLSEAEENVVKIRYAYNLARMQYKNNTGDFVY